MNYNNRKFKPLTVSDNGEVSKEIIFHYFQSGNILSCDYAGGSIIKGHLLGKVDANGNIEMRYHQINQAGEIMTGKCKSKPVSLDNGKLKLIEEWQWTSGDQSKGHSVLVEI